ncbi:MAG: hypothetical protein JSS12_02645 [Verrucomicrobia bacterium]|nr:hypothetical protein [Verrucomicrobiota bacterium]
MVRVDGSPPQHFPEEEKKSKDVKDLSGFSKAIYHVKEAFSNLRKAFSRPVYKEVQELQEVPIAFNKGNAAAQDSKFYYRIVDGKVWFKPIAAAESAPWKEFGSGSFKAVSISADGDNVIVIDNEKKVHYAKSHSMNVHLVDESWEITSDSKVSWTTKWFNMYLVAPIRNRFKDPTLTIENVRSFGISHKGKDARYYTDITGKKHPDPYIGVTTLYVLSNDGTRYYFADPWLSNKFENEITGPEDGQFVAENMAVAGSTLFVIQRALDTSGKEIHKMYTRYADFDSIGSNPALPATYNQDNKTPLIRILPAEDWREQPPIVLEGQAYVSKDIQILQTGQGQAQRQLRVAGLNAEGKSGYYFKNIYDQDWKFEETKQPVVRDQLEVGFKSGPKIANDYAGTIVSSLKNIKGIQLTKFSRRGLNERGLHTKVEITLVGDKKLEIPLYARRGLRHLLGFDLSSKRLYWTMVVPKEYRESDDPDIQRALKVLFNNRKTMKVHVDERPEGEIVITPEFFSSKRFTMRFE